MLRNDPVGDGRRRLFHPPNGAATDLLKPDTLALTLLLALLTSLGPLSTDMYLPSLPSIVAAFDTSVAHVQLTLTLFMLGFAAGQVIYGPVADRIGRKPVLMAALVLYVAASVVCAATPSLEVLIGARFVQAFAAAGPIVLARTVVRDLYEGVRAGRELSTMGTMMSVVPAAAPMIGGFLQDWFGWRSSFAASVLLGSIALAAVASRLPETLREPDPTPISAAGILDGFGRLLRDRPFVLHLALIAATYGGLFAFISGSSFVLQREFGFSGVLYGIAFGFCALAYMAGTFLARLLGERVGLELSIGIGTGFLFGGGLAMLVSALTGFGQSLGIILPQMLYMVGLGITLPAAQANALMPYPDRAGSASSLIGVAQMTLGAVVSIVVGFGVEAAVWPMPAAIAVLGAMAAIAERGLVRLRRGGAAG